jgi:hypothetical protein
MPDAFEEILLNAAFDQQDERDRDYEDLLKAVEEKGISEGTSKNKFPKEKLKIINQYLLWYTKKSCTQSALLNLNN